jgi:hypothetical protein
MMILQQTEHEPAQLKKEESGALGGVMQCLVLKELKLWGHSNVTHHTLMHSYINQLKACNLLHHQSAP